MIWFYNTTSEKPSECIDGHDKFFITVDDYYQRALIRLTLRILLLINILTSRGSIKRIMILEIFSNTIELHKKGNISIKGYAHLS